MISNIKCLQVFKCQVEGCVGWSYSLSKVWGNCTGEIFNENIVASGAMVSLKCQVSVLVRHI